MGKRLLRSPRAVRFFASSLTGARDAESAPLLENFLSFGEFGWGSSYNGWQVAVSVALISGDSYSLAEFPVIEFGYCIDELN